MKKIAPPELTITRDYSEIEAEFSEVKGSVEELMQFIAAGGGSSSSMSPDQGASWIGRGEVHPGDVIARAFGAKSLDYAVGAPSATHSYELVRNGQASDAGGRRQVSLGWVRQGGGQLSKKASIATVIDHRGTSEKRIWLMIHGHHVMHRVVEQDDISQAAGAGGSDRVVSSVPGKVISVLVKSGDQVRDKQTVVVLESMKMEIEVKTTRAGKINRLLVKNGDQVAAGALLADFESAD